MRPRLCYVFLFTVVVSLYFTACDSTTSSNNFEESVQIYTDLEPVQEGTSVRATINRGENVSKSVGSDSWFQIKLENIGANDIINNGTVGAWCIEWNKPLKSDNDVHEGTKLYSTRGAVKWEPINYFFSIKNELKMEDPSLTAREFQAVVWSLVGYMGIAPEFDVMKLPNKELPSRLLTNGKPNFSKQKVLDIFNRVKREYASAKLKTIPTYVTVMETDKDEQDVVIPDPPPVIEVDTNIYIYFDASGSMNATLRPLQIMRDTQLKEALLPLYDGNETAYNNRVNVIEWCNFSNCERTFKVADLEGAAPPADGNLVVLIFQDEAQTTYHPSAFSFDPNASRTTNYETDIAALRSRLDNFATNKGSNYYRSVIFQVDGFPGFKSFIQAVQNGTGNYAGASGLSDRNEFNYVYDVVDGDTPETYRDLVIQALQDLGFAIPTP